MWKEDKINPSRSRGKEKRNKWSRIKRTASKGDEE